MKYLARYCILVFSFFLSSNNFANVDAALDTLELQAKNAFKQGQYNQALGFYRQLDQQHSSYTSRYNLAVCYYKLARWQESVSAFSALLEEDPSDERVQLNLGLAEQKNGNYGRAAEHFLALADLAESDAIATVAYKNYLNLLDTLDKQHKALDQQNKDSSGDWLLSAALSYGGDDNVISVIDESASTIADSFTEANLSAAWYNTADFRNNWFVDANLYTSRYSEVSDYDVDVLAIGAKKHYSPTANHRLVFGLRFDQSSVGGEDYMRSSYFELADRMTLTGQQSIKLGLRYQIASELDAQYHPFAGSSSRLYARWSRYHGDSRWTLRYQFDNDDKNDGGGLETDAGNISYISYSAWRHTFQGVWSYESAHWYTRLDLSYRSSEYKDPHISTSDIIEYRKDNRISTGVQLTRMFNDNWSLEASAIATHNMSTIDSYDYNQNMLSLTLMWQN